MSMNSKTTLDNTTDQVIVSGITSAGIIQW